MKTGCRMGNAWYWKIKDGKGSLNDLRYQKAGKARIEYRYMYRLGSPLKILPNRRKIGN